MHVTRLEDGPVNTAQKAQEILGLVAWQAFAIARQGIAARDVP